MFEIIMAIATLLTSGGMFNHDPGPKKEPVRVERRTDFGERKAEAEKKQEQKEEAKVEEPKVEEEKK